MSALLHILDLLSNLNSKIFYVSSLAFFSSLHIFLKFYLFLYHGLSTLNHNFKVCFHYLLNYNSVINFIIFIICLIISVHEVYLSFSVAYQKWGGFFTFRWSPCLIRGMGQGSFSQFSNILSMWSSPQFPFMFHPLY